VYAGRTLAEVAGLDDVQVAGILFRPRDKYGRLRKRPDLPPGVEVDDEGMRVVKNPVPYAVMFRQVRRRQGLNEEQVEASWREFLSANPKFGKGS